MATDLHPPREVTLDPPDSPPHRLYRRLATTLLITLVAAFSVLIAGGLAIFHNEAPGLSRSSAPAASPCSRNRS
ncbi:hypothetical protein PACID_31700 [Acidipropionibacterium acidipropionici ATCC 4875]|uniref:Uncharacterized protein n=1 Tax=Acidipropionibacterium acidipropionici (strain ATCC 4875 / DSM 20272 / JCM 6432 / NBRC 12425 / NCIMB 8070 / 4) TaxID=1171373 RepID=K7SP04_ACIA4|nr:hypothetical protein [Acidipropionibacterium acidipropionici]AFV90930.1 hypothetical protein PACID_31700 [Acidipropionibacterium acidipropionici ATCC 4875]